MRTLWRDRAQREDVWEESVRRAAKVDGNQHAIVRALRDCGCSVQSLAAVGAGVPDLLVGVRGENLLLEVKDGRKAPSRRGLTPAQEEWHAGWRGRVAVVSCAAEALAAVGARMGGDRVREMDHNQGNSQGTVVLKADSGAGAARVREVSL